MAANVDREFLAGTQRGVLADAVPVDQVGAVMNTWAMRDRVSRCAPYETERELPDDVEERLIDDCARVFSTSLAGAGCRRGPCRSCVRVTRPCGCAWRCATANRRCAHVHTRAAAGAATVAVDACRGEHHLGG